jgi:hypothetical protein
MPNQNSAGSVALFSLGVSILAFIVGCMRYWLAHLTYRAVPHIRTDAFGADDNETFYVFLPFRDGRPIDLEVPVHFENTGERSATKVQVYTDAYRSVEVATNFWPGARFSLSSEDASLRSRSALAAWDIKDFYLGKEEKIHFMLRVNVPSSERDITVTSTTKDGHEVQATFIPYEVISLAMDVWYLEGRSPITRFWKLVFLDALRDGARKHFNTSNVEYRAAFAAHITTLWKLVIWATHILRYGIEIEPFAVIVCPDELDAPALDTGTDRVKATSLGWAQGYQVKFHDMAGMAYVIPELGISPSVQVPGGRMFAWLANFWKGILAMSARKTLKQNRREISVRLH